MHNNGVPDQEKTKGQLLKEITALRAAVEELKAVEKECRRAEDSFRRAEYDKAVILRSVTELITYQNKNLRIIWANKAAGDSMGLPPEELVGHYCYEIWHKRKTPCENCPVLKAIGTGESQDGEVVSSDKRTWFIRGYPVLGESGEIIGAVEVTTELTARRHAEAELKKSEEKFRNIVERSYDVIVLTDLEGRITYVSPQAVKVLEYHPHEIMGKLFREFVMEKDTKKAESIFKDAAVGKRFEGEELSLLRKDKDDIIIELNVIPVVEEDKVIGVQAVFRDITVRKKAEERIKASEERWKVIFDYAPVAYYVYDLEGRFVDGNKAAEKLLGYRKEELLGQSFIKSKLLLPEEAHKAVADLARNAKGESTGPEEFTLIRRDGTKVPVEMTTHPMSIGGRTLVMGIAMDITERKEAEIELQRRMESLEKFQKITVGRELRVRELKERLKEMEDRLRGYETSGK